MDYLLLKLTTLMLRQAPSRWRMMTGTLLASAIVLLLFTPLSNVLNSFFGKLFYSMLIIWVVFGVRNIKVFLKALSLFYLSAFMIGGGLFAIHFFFQNQLTEQLQSLSNTSYGDPISWIFILIGFPALWLFSKKQVDHWVVRRWQHNETLQIQIKLGQESWSWVGRVDSGNSCKDPFSQRPVLFVQPSSLPDSFLFLQGNQRAELDKNSLDLAVTENLKERVTYIPFQTISHELQYAPAIKADQLIIKTKDEQLVYSSFYIMCSQTAFSMDGKIDCLLHPDMVLKALAIKAVS